MNHISIEGMDGVGKSTTCKLLSERLGYKFVEKPLHYLFDESEEKFDEYIRIRDQVNANQNRIFNSFWGAGWRPRAGYEDRRILLHSDAPQLL